MPGTLLKLLMKDKLPHSREVPMNVKEWQLAETPKERERIKIKADELNNQHERLAAETPEERETRLQQVRDRLTVETPEEREARLQQMSINQRERLAVENSEERELRLQHYSANV